MKLFVLDCSVTMAWCLEDEKDAYADATLEALAKGSALAPQLWVLEVLNVLVTAERRRRLSAADAGRFLQLLGGLPIGIEPGSGITASDSVWQLARQNQLSAYDAAYLDLAVREGLPVATRDEKLRQACKVQGVEVFKP